MLPPVTLTEGLAHYLVRTLERLRAARPGRMIPLAEVVRYALEKELKSINDTLDQEDQQLSFLEVSPWETNSLPRGRAASPQLPAPPRKKLAVAKKPAKKPAVTKKPAIDFPRSRSSGRPK